MRKRKRKKRKKKLSKREEKNGRKKLEKQEEKARKDEIRLKKQAEKVAKKKPRRKQTDVEDPNPFVESDIEPEPDLEPSESGLQSHKISNNQCALYCSLYEDDLSPTRRLEREWVQCTRVTCMKWMRSDCLNKQNGVDFAKCIFVN